MSSVTIQDLLEAGAHFGHQTKRWNPKMKRYILCPRNGVYIIDLNKTVHCINKFLDRVRTEVQNGGKVLFVGTKKQIKDCVQEEAIRCGMPFVTERWLGGMLTNFQTIRQSIRSLEKIETMETDGTMEALTKKEALMLLKRKEKLASVLTGVRDLRKTPTVIFVVDTIKEHIAVAEARRLRMAIGAIVDTNCDPEEVDYPIPANDDALKSVQLITKLVADTIVETGVTIRAEEMAALARAAEARKEGGAEELENPESVAEEGEEAPGEEGKAGARKRRVVRRRIAEVTEEEE